MKKSEKLSKEESSRQVEYEIALSYINSKGFDIETKLNRSYRGKESTDIVEIIMMKDGVKFVDSMGLDRVKRFPLSTNLLTQVADSVINLSKKIKEKE